MTRGPASSLGLRGNAPTCRESGVAEGLGPVAEGLTLWRLPAPWAKGDAAVAAAEGCWSLYSRIFSLYDVGVVSDEQIQEWADEAEAGYDVDELKRRGRGRPGRGAEPMQVVAVRLTAEELDALDAAAAKNEMSRSDAIRAALARFAA